MISSIRNKLPPFNKIITKSYMKEIRFASKKKAHFLSKGHSVSLEESKLICLSCNMNILRVHYLYFCGQLLSIIKNRPPSLRVRQQTNLDSLKLVLKQLQPIITYCKIFSFETVLSHNRHDVRRL
jgi:hypothetical protein